MFPLFSMDFLLNGNPNVTFDNTKYGE